YSHTGLTPNTTYYYRLQAEHSTLGDSAYTPLLGATTPAGTTPGSVEVRIACGADDIEQPQDGAMDLASSDLEMTEDGDRVQLVGLRFAGVGIPAGASITAAYVQFAADETGSAATSLKIGGEAAADARPFSTAAYDAGGRPRTAASVSWSAPAWANVGEAGAAQRTPDLSAVIQEIVDLPGWQTGNALVLLISGSGKRVARAYEGDVDGAALLHVEFTAMPGDNDADGVGDAWEQALFGSTSSADSAPDADPDGDGYSNLEEFVAGTNPNSDTQYFDVGLRLTADKKLIVSFETVALGGTGYEGFSARHYGLEQTDDFNNPAWTAVPGYEDIVGTGQTVSFANTAPQDSQSYRAKVWLE
ncbi:MAG: hypothetical protein JXR37_18625, partial [Kiritimatiellae bacterium]|nr:hypothetical protein [Kiritimatiellia bacterium]